MLGGVLPRATAANEAEGKGHQSFNIDYAPEKRMSRRLPGACQRCREAGIEGDRKRSVCTACKWARTSVAFTYAKQRKNNRCNVDAREKLYKKFQRSTFSRESEVTTDRKKEIEGLKNFSKDLQFKMPKGSQTERTQNIDPWDSPVRRQGEPTPHGREVDHKNLELPETLLAALSILRLQISHGVEYNLINSFKVLVQYLTGEEWDWWPLRPSFRQLREDESRIQWHCVSHDLRFINPGMLKLQRFLDTHIGQYSPKLPLLHRRRLLRGKLPHILPLQRESQNHHQRTIQSQVQAEALDQSHLLGSHLQLLRRVAHLIRSMTRRGPMKIQTHQAQVSRLMLYRQAI